MYICHWFPIYPQLLVVSPIVSTCVNMFTNLAIIFVMIVSSLPIFAVFVVTMFLFVGALLPGRAALLGCILGIPEQSAALLVAAGGRTGFSTCFQGPKKSGPCRFEVHEIDALQIDVLDDFEFDTLLIHVDIYIYIYYIACIYVLNMDQRCHLQAIEFAGWVIGQEPYYLIVWIYYGSCSLCIHCLVVFQNSTHTLPFGNHVHDTFMFTFPDQYSSAYQMIGRIRGIIVNHPKISARWSMWQV